MPKRSSKRDFSQVALDIVRQVTEEPTPAKEEATTSITPDLDDEDTRKAVMREMGKRGGLKGGKARAEKLTAEERTKIATDAAKKRWTKNSEPDTEP